MTRSAHQRGASGRVPCPRSACAPGSQPCMLLAGLFCR
ncbi:hypothetical protein BURMUCF1_2561 [Burkholderia multivorans ATCC BAA-247]|uniref:Uncharacterized protein n=1 Tax=Burkholderia multivorans CGD2 TaxID=513052 RepID=B9BR95_9BURK|nr:hypothetical protein BURMUCGD2_0923 [Burkholderia multivorans CGD2]EEE12916.1 hypothetical protein BURMUCGD2M_1014 [Burkholderia multivorans CGD2M]EJO54500.1 hypothetical protein BURMUCF1_2561 [Burkholderia multivorans ATCC BAA-247]